MTVNALRHAVPAATLGLAAGTASAHQGPQLISHLHPHPGVEPLLVVAGLVLAVYGLRRLLRRH